MHFSLEFTSLLSHLSKNHYVLLFDTVLKIVSLYVVHIVSYNKINLVLVTSWQEARVPQCDADSAEAVGRVKRTWGGKDCNT